MGIVIHVGRRTRTVYRTPVIVFRTKDGFRFALTYGRDSEWVQNALAHGAVGWSPGAGSTSSPTPRW